MVAHSLKYARNGFSVIPISRWNKRPVVSWQQYQKTKPSITDLLQWFNRDRHNIGLVCGEISGNLTVIDFDDPDYYRDMAMLLIGLPTVATQKGFHVYIKSKTRIRNAKIAVDRGKVLAELRGNGGYVVAPPSRYPNKRYQTIGGSLFDVPLLDKEEFDNLVSSISINASLDSVDIGEYTGDGENLIVSNSIESLISTVVERVVSSVQCAFVSTRNDALFRASAEMGNYVGSGYINESDAVQLLFDAAIHNGMVSDDGKQSALQTIRSGIKTGCRNPIKIQVESVLMGL